MTTAPPALTERLDVPDGQDAPTGLFRRRFTIIAAAVVVLGVLATYVVAFSPVFAAKNVQVRGARGAVADLVRRAAAIDPSTPLARLDSTGIAHRVSAVAVISSAQVITSFPSTVVITVTERAAIGVSASGSKFALVDRTGDQFATVDARPHGLPLFVVAGGADAKPTRAAVATVAAALDSSLRARIASIQAVDPTAITLLLKSKRVVQWGSADQSAAKARILLILLTQRGDQFDVTDPYRPFSR